MFSKEESARLRQEFWTSFGKSFPRKWILYHTRVKDVSFKFYFDTKKAMILFDLECDPISRAIYFEKLLQVKSILQEEYLPEVDYQERCFLSTGKEITRLSVELQGVCIHNKNTWGSAMEFLSSNMEQFERFWHDYKEFIFE